MPVSAPHYEPYLIDAVLERMSAHLDRLAAQVFYLEETVASHFTDTGDTAAAAIREFQALDLLRQSLEDMSLLSLLVAKSQSRPPQDIQNLANSLKLDSTKAVLMGSVGSGFVNSQLGAGELDLF